MKRLIAAVAVAAFAAACASTTEEPVSPPPPPPPPLGFFLTSAPAPGGANLGGLAGADAMCQQMAAAVGAGSRTWRAYLSAEATDTSGPVNARDRIGSGPWYNANGVLIASSVAELHSPSARLSKETTVTETGAVVNGRGDEPNQHDVLTGSFADGTLYIEKDIRSTTCENWTSGADEAGVVARVGHHDRVGGGPDPTSWNNSHNSRGCSLETLRATGGDGRFMCFAAN